ncbi:MAG: helix-turn-helix domain-containing protein [Lachnospiraceae bacterium]|jgi:beta-xylosidase/AraC-like DNA-binding protein|nr:helix-turn-helix domain-containing protein [Lachnospiraceae bacterium]
MSREIPDRENFVVEIRDTADGTERLQENISLIYVLDGSLEVRVESKRTSLGKEGVLVINEGRQYSFQAGGRVLYLNFAINAQMMRDVCKQEDFLFWCNSAAMENSQYDRLRRTLRKLLNEYLKTGGGAGDFGFLSLCCDVVNQLIVNFMIRPTDQQEQGEDEHFDERLRKINQYIYAYYDQPISMKELSEKLYLSNGYLSRFFKKHYGTSFADYLTGVRLSHTVDELLNTDAPVTRIAYQCGFASAAVFNHAFRKVYGQTPTDYRREHAGKQDAGTLESRQKVVAQKAMKVLSEQGGTDDNEEELLFDTQEFSVADPKPLQRNWGSLINLGAASTALLQSETHTHLLMLRHALHFHYARFWSLFSEDFLIDPDIPANENYNFNRIDTALDSILEQEMIPFIDLGMKPLTIHFGIGMTRMEPSGKPFTNESWFRLIRAFMEHLSFRYGQEELSQWRMELWFDEEWRTREDGPDRYLEIFRGTKEIIREFNDKILFGGYGIRMDGKHDRRLQFYKKWSASGCRPDFLAVMAYAYERGEGEEDRFAMRVSDDDFLLHYLTRERELFAEAGLGDLPVILEEWNLTPCVRNYINDSAYKGAYIVKNILDVYGMVDEIGYAVGSDHNSVYYDTSGLLFGGTGLLTKDGVLKPAGYAFDFLHRLYGNLAFIDRKCMVTTDGHDGYAIICHNEQMLNDNYYRTQEDHIDKEQLWKYSEPWRSMKLSLTMRDVQPGTYQVKIRRVNEMYGNILKLWGDLGYEQDLSREDIEYFRRVCEPNLTIRNLEAADGALLLEEELQPNEIALIQIRKLH